MSDVSTVPDSHPSQEAKRPAPAPRPDRGRNLARALKANMGRRKAAARAAEESADTGENS